MTLPLFLLTLLHLQASAPRHIHMNVFYNGSAVGGNTYDSDGAGGFKSSSILNLGSFKVASELQGHLKDGKLADYSGTSTSPTSDATFLFKDKHLTVTVKGKPTTVPYEDKTGYLGGNTHPQITLGTILAAEAALKSPSTKQTSLNAFFLDVGSVIPIKFASLPSKPVIVNGVKQIARRFSASIGTIDFEYDLSDDNTVVAQDIPSQKIRLVADGWEGLFDDPLKKYPELSQPTFKVKKESGVKVKMRDGVELVCDVIRPDDLQKHPAILVRTPYGRSTETVNGDFYASRGYALVAEDCRGREASGGEWDPFVHEGPDGYDTIGWLAEQPWCDGKVGMIGGSYAGYVQWAAAVLRPPALKCIVPQVSPPDAMRNIPYDFGIFALYPDLWWAKIVATRTADFSDMKGNLPKPRGLATLPLSKVDDAALGQNLEFFDKWLSRTTISDWKGFDFTYSIQNSNVPALHISGTWDGDEIGTHLNWQALHNRPDQWMIFGPWVHAFNTTHSIGDVEYGNDAIIEIDSMYLRWFDTWLKGKDVGLNKVPRVRLFVNSANKWISLPDWPAPWTPARKLYLTRTALQDSPGKDESATYTYDPATDTALLKLMDKAGGGEGSTKVTGTTMRKGESLLVRTAPFKKATGIATPADLDLRFKTSAKDTDFFFYLLDEAPNGELRLVGQPGKIRGSYIGGMDKVRPLFPNREYRAAITHWDFAHEFAVGHRLALLLTSSRFPLYARNLGTGEPIKSATRMVVQKNTILMGAAHPSSLTVHVLYEH